ncbi:MAG: haloacid dehalogenase-like hydrolase [Flavobacteriaceae bacterium]
MQNKEVHIFDICGTLYHSNTTYDFLLFYFKRNNGSKYRKYQFCFSLVSKVIWKLLTFLGYKKWIRNFLVSFIKNEPESMVTTEANEFVKLVLIHKEVAFVKNILLKTKNNPNMEIWFVSASIEPVVKAIAKHFDITNYVSTILAVNNHRFTGKMIEDLEGKKHVKLTQEGILKPNAKRVVYTDSKEDVALVQQSEKAYLVGQRKNETYWKDKVSSKTEIIFV